MAHDTCVFCGVAKGSTRDHIPPENLFPSPKPTNLITVPSCFACNLGTSKDDMYFRDCLILWQKTSGHAAADQVAESVLQSFRIPKRKRYCWSLLNNVVDVDLISSGGIYWGKAKALKIDRNRLMNTASKIVKGLFFHEYGEILPDSHSATAVPLVEEYLPDPDQRKGVLETCDHLIRTPRTTLGQGVFSYWHHRYDDDPHKSLWLLLFYEKMAFLGMTPDRTSVSVGRATRTATCD